MKRSDFERLVAEAVLLIPKRFRHEMKNLAIIIEEEPTPELLDELEIEPPDTLYGLYQGTPLPERSWAYGNTLPDRITLFQRPVEKDCENQDDIRVAIGETLIHEVGHYFGLSEEEIQEIEERYWRGVRSLRMEGGGGKRSAGAAKGEARTPKRRRTRGKGEG